jgi:hypothetical protein
MSRALRLSLTWLLLVTLPLQGYAAGSMLFCGAGAATSGVVEHSHDAAASHDLQGAHQHDAVAAAAVDDGDASNLHDVMHGKCSVCSSCCSAAALPSAPIAATSATPRAAPLHDLEHANPGHGPARLERPPR